MESSHCKIFELIKRQCFCEVLGGLLRFKRFDKACENTDTWLLCTVAKLMLNQVKTILLCQIVSLMMPLSLQCYLLYYAWCLFSLCQSFLGLFDSDVTLFCLQLLKLKDF